MTHIQIALLLCLISLISQIQAEDTKASGSNTVEVKYAGPIVYTNEKPPIVYFPTPPTTSSTDQIKSVEQNASLRNGNIEYVPFPYQDLPVLIYKSKDMPPFHVVPDGRHNDSSNNNLNTNIEKRLGETTITGNSQRGGRALKWSNFKLFNDMPLVMKAPKWVNTDANKGVGQLLSNSFVDISNKSLLSTGNTQMALASAPHVIYSGHPPIHVFPQPIIIKEPEMTAEMTAASELFQSLKKPNSGNIFDISMSPSNKHEISSNPSSTQYYSYSGTPLGSGNGKSYGFRMNTRGNKQDTEYSGSQNYDNYDDSYSQQHSDGSSDGQSEDKFKPSTHFTSGSSSSSDSSSSDSNDKDFDKLSESYSRERSRDKFPKYESSNLMDMDVDNGWLSSLLGYNRWPRPPPPRRPMAFMGNPNEHLMFASTHSNPMSIENMQLMNAHMRPNTHWMTAMNGMRPTASAMRPVYTLGSLFGYRRPPIPSHPTHYIARPGMSLAHQQLSSALSPLSVKPISLSPQLMGMQSMSYPVRIPYSPFMMYGLRRPMGLHSADLAFAESNRNTTTNANIATDAIKWSNYKEDIQMAASHVQPTFVLPNSSPTPTAAKSTSATVTGAQTKPPIIIYQGLRPPVHVYKQPNLTVRDQSEVQQNLMSALQQLEAIKNGVNGGDAVDSTTTASTDNPYYQLYQSTEESPNNQPFDDNSYKTASSFYINDNSAFSPRHSSGEWIPIKQTTEIKDNSN